MAKGPRGQVARWPGGCAMTNPGPLDFNDFPGSLARKTVMGPRMGANEKSFGRRLTRINAGKRRPLNAETRRRRERRPNDNKGCEGGGNCRVTPGCRARFVFSDSSFSTTSQVRLLEKLAGNHGGWSGEGLTSRLDLTTWPLGHSLVLR